MIGLRKTFYSLVVCIIAGAFASVVHAQQTSTVRIARGLNQPVFAASTEARPNELFIIEKSSGQIRILDTTTNEVASDPFARVAGLATQSEAGLLGMAFHPGYAENGRFYVYASRPGGSGNHQSNILEYTVEGDPLTSNVVDPNSERTVLQFDQPFGNHNGGWIGFDPTATGDARTYLHIASGDGGSGGDPQNNSQDVTNNLLGKVLRIDINGNDFLIDNDRNYAIPPTNPHVDGRGDDEIFAHGLRNPWRASFDRGTGDLWIGDVGQGAREEIDLIPAGTSGQNFGWRVMEADQCFRSGDATPCNDPSFTAPAYAYSQGSGVNEGRSVTGGYLYRGALKEFEQQYIFGDYVSGNVWSMDPYSGRVTNINNAIEADRGAANSGLASFAEDASGELHMISLNSGSIFKLTSSSRDVTWAGDSADSGAAGDGTTWSDAANWVRDGVPDTAFEAGDHLVLGGGQSLAATEARRVSALTFESDAELTVSGGELNIVSGNIFVEGSATGRLDAELDSDVRIIRKMGEGHLVMAGEATRNAVLVDGTLTMETGRPLILWQAGGRFIATGTSMEFGTTARLEMTDGRLDLTPVELDDATLSDQAVLEVTRDLELSGSLVAHLPDGFVPPTLNTTKSLPLIYFGRPKDSIVGQFDEMLVGDKPAGHIGEALFVDFEWTDVEGGDSVLSMNVFQWLLGDADFSGDVGFPDFLELSENFNMSGGWAEGDFTADGLVNFDDFLVLSGNFGAPRDPEPNGVPGVPEPAGHTLALVFVTALLVVRRRNR